MKLVYTPRSHFARKVRILLDAWAESVDLVDAGNVGAMDAEAFGGNPLMAVPVLLDDGHVLFDSDTIAHYLVRKRGGADTFQVLTTDVNTLNARAVMNGVMAAEVEVVLAKRSGIDVDKYPRFAKKHATIRRGLEWLEANAHLFEGEPTYAGFHLVAMLDHLVACRMAELEHPRLQSQLARYSAIAFVRKSRPPD